MDACRVDAYLNALRCEDLVDDAGRVLILMHSEPGVLFHHGDFRTEPAEHLRKLKSHISAADDDEMARELLQLENAAAGEEWHGIDTGHLRNQRAGADIEKDLR